MDLKAPRPMRPMQEIRAAAIVGVALFALLAGTIGVWASTAPLASAVVVPGKVVVEGSSRRIQHPTGGVVAAINVHDGDRVEAGDVLIRLDSTSAQANLGVIDVQLHQLTMRRARLEAERDGLDRITVPEALSDRVTEPAIAAIIRGEEGLFASRRLSTAGQIDQLNERITQIEEEKRAVAAQSASKRQQLDIVERERTGIASLYERGLTSLSRLTALEREAAQLAGEAGQLDADAARNGGRIAETRLEIIQVGRDFNRDVTAELREVEGEMGDLLERRSAAADQLARVELRAPEAGIVHENTVHTVGGVISPGEQVMVIVPNADGLVIDARIEPQLIDRVQPGQEVLLRFSAFNSATTPDLSGSLERVSADLSTDPHTGATFYMARIALQPGQLTAFSGRPLLPGMPVEAFVQTGERTAIGYLMKPFADQLARAFRYD